MKLSMMNLSTLIAALLLVSLVVHAQAGLSPVEQAAISDATGKKVGNIIGFLPEGSATVPVVALKSSGLTLFLTVTPNAFGSVPPSVNGGLNFESANCTGTGFTGFSVPSTGTVLSLYHLAGSKI